MKIHQVWFVFLLQNVGKSKNLQFQREERAVRVVKLIMSFKKSLLQLPLLNSGSYQQLIAKQLQCRMQCLYYANGCLKLDLRGTQVAQKTRHHSHLHNCFISVTDSQHLLLVTHGKLSGTLTQLINKLTAAKKSMDHRGNPLFQSRRETEI